MNCAQCGVEDARNQLTFLETEYHFCDTCFNSDRVIFRAYNGIMAPYSAGLDIEYIYDGNDEDPVGCGTNTGRAYLFNDAQEETNFICNHCGHSFYNDGITTLNTDQIYCANCSNNSGYIEYDEDDDSYYDNRFDVNGNLIPTARNCNTNDSNTLPMLTGNESQHFLTDYHVGFEFEHAPVRYKGEHTSSEFLFDLIRGIQIDQLKMRDAFTLHHDGSITSMGGYSSSEIVSMPASGDNITRVVKAFYRPFAQGDFTPGPEHPSCGFHMHVESRVIKHCMNTRDTMAAGYHDWRIQAVNALNMIDKICKEFISSTRKSNRFCNGRPSMREKGTGRSNADVLKYVYGSTAYPSVAVRTMGTIEYRLWPSSNSYKYTMARAELSQKMTKYYDMCLLNEDLKPNVDAAKVAKLAKVAEMCAPVKRKELVTHLSALLNLSNDCADSLNALNEKFNPYTYGKTHFKFTEIQLALIDDEPSDKSTDYGAFTKDSIEVVGDTTIRISGRETGMAELLLTWANGVKCYPAVQVGEQVDAVRHFAEGAN